MRKITSLLQLNKTFSFACLKPILKKPIIKYFMAVRFKTSAQRQAQNNQNHACTAVPNKRQHFRDLHLTSPAYLFQ